MAPMSVPDQDSLVIRVYLLCTLVAITFMYTSAIAVYMAKLYWRLKVNNVWNWRPVVDHGVRMLDGTLYHLVPVEQAKLIVKLEEEE